MKQIVRFTKVGFIMDDKKDLIFVTEHFPFGSGEAFIENEIGIVASAYQRVFILTTTPVDDDIRELPSNVILLKSNRPPRPKEILPALFSYHYWLEILKVLLFPRKQWFALNFFGKAITIAQYK